LFTTAIKFLADERTHRAADFTAYLALWSRFWLQREQNGIAKVALLDLATLSSPRLLDVNPRISSGVQFTSQGNAIAYGIRENGVDNVWIGHTDSDVVLLQGAKR